MSNIFVPLGVIKMRNEETRGRKWQSNLSNKEQTERSQMSSRENQRKVLRGARYPQAGNRDARQLRRRNDFVAEPD